MKTIKINKQDDDNYDMLRYDNFFAAVASFKLTHSKMGWKLMPDVSLLMNVALEMMERQAIKWHGKW